jgi:membrane protease YdiL (CAAX protease family)
MQRQALIRLVLLHGAACLFFYLLYHTSNPRPYTNIAYFLGLGLISCWAMRKEKINPRWDLSISWKYTGLGTLLMLVIYLGTRLGYRLAVVGRLPINIQPGRWLYFARPWQEINQLISVIGILVVVVALELFYRNYTLELLRPKFRDWGALIISSALSMLRGGTLGPVTGGYDGMLALIWGFIYLRAGLLPAIITHLVWDILFIYLTP